jgi:hypothetical protein
MNVEKELPRSAVLPWRLPLFFLVWIVIIAIKLPTALVGPFVVPVLYKYRHKKFNDVPWIFRPWQNPEDWADGPEGTLHSLPQWWINENGFGFWAWFHYHAIRNPANGLRNFEWIDLEPVPEKIKFWTPQYLRWYEPKYMRTNGVKSAGYICWQGWRMGCKYVRVWNDERHLQFKFGWRIGPNDALGHMDPDGQRALDGAGFATKFLPYREG